MTTEITVRGSYSAFESPERATVHATIGYEGREMQPVYDRVARDLEVVKASITPLHHQADGPVTWWSAEQLRTWSNRPWNQDGKQLPLVHHASVDVQVKFSDFAELSRWVGTHVVGTEGFRVSRVEWTLTGDRRQLLLKEVRTRAVHDAINRAQLYAAALGLASVRPSAIADVGMLGTGVSHHDAAPGAYMRASAPHGHDSSVELVPEQIELSASVDARFVADA